MGTFTDVFERKEVKYCLDAQQFAWMRSALDGHMAPDMYGNTRIMSLYLDTPERLLIERSLNKPVYKEKLRLRSYGLPSEDSRVFVEIKKKYDGIVYKRRVGLSYAAARAYLGGLSYEEACACYPLENVDMHKESLAPRSIQIAREIDQFVLSYQPLRASMVIDCMRTAYAPAESVEAALAVSAAPFGDLAEGGASNASPSNALLNEEADGSADDLRITFDTNLGCRDLFVDKAETSPLASLLPSGEAVMEVKSAGPFPLWLVQALDSCRAYPSSFSKYGEAYKLSMQNNQAEPKRHRRTSSRLAAEEAAEYLTASVRDIRPRRFWAPNFVIKKGGRCA